MRVIFNVCIKWIIYRYHGGGYMLEVILEMKTIFSKKCPFLWIKGHVNTQSRHFLSQLPKNNVVHQAIVRRWRRFKYHGKMNKLELSRIKIEIWDASEHLISIARISRKCVFNSYSHIPSTEKLGFSPI